MEGLTRIKESLLKSCCTIIYNNSVKGTGWVAGKNLIVSAGHCFSEVELEQINADEINKGEIRARFRSEPSCQALGTTMNRSLGLNFQSNANKENTWKDYKAEFLCGAYSNNPLIDFCVLRTVDTLQVDALPIAEKDCLEGDFYTAGYGETLERVSSGEGKILGLINGDEEYRPLKLSSKQCSELGYSGAPIYSQIADGVIGIQSRITEKEIGAESETILAFPIKYLIDNKILDTPLSFFGAIEKSDLDKAMSLRDKGDVFFAESDYKNAKKNYTKAKEYLIGAVGEKGAYIDDINRRIGNCEYSRKSV